MGCCKCLAYVASGVGAAVLAPMTGSTLAVAIGAMSATAAIDHASSASEMSVNYEASLA